jgi:hypothetical protein
MNLGFLGRQPGGIRPTGRHRSRWEDNINGSYRNMKELCGLD